MDQFQHATNCDINMTGKTTRSIDDCLGCLVMIDILHPEDMSPVIQAGTIMDCNLVAYAKSIGIDYVIVYRGKI